MNVIERIVKNESVEDVITLFALNKGLPSLDMMFSRYRRDVIVSGEFLRTYRRLFDEGVLAPGDNIVAAKGPNWREPQFLSDKTYRE